MNTGRIQPDKGRRTEAALALFLMIVTLAVYGQTVGFGFVHIDDNVYVTGNQFVRSGLTASSLKWALTDLEAGFWHPLTWFSLMLDAQFHGNWAGGFHLTNVLLHMMATLILFLTFSRMTGEAWRSAFVAGMFALHPLHVESVAWIAERKDVLSGFFWMSGMAAYAWYAAQPGPCRYGLLLSVFLLGLMAKPMLVTLPFALLLLDVWPLDRVGRDPAGMNQGRFRRDSWSRLLLEKVPLVSLSVGFSVLTYWAEYQAGALSAGASHPLQARMANALVSYATYLEKMLWPAGLAVFYPHPGTWPGTRVLLSALLLAGISGAILVHARRRPFLGVGWLWYLGTLVPVIGIIQIGNIAMADRFTYLPLVGPAIMMAWGVPGLFARWAEVRIRRSVSMAGAAFLIVCAILSWQQVRYWEDTESLFRQALSVTDGNYKAHHGVGTALLEQGRIAEAEDHIRQSLELRNDDRARNDMGVIYLKQGRFVEAEEQFKKASTLKPAVARYWNNQGAALGLQGKTSESVPYFEQALRIDPSYTEARRNLEQALDRHTPNG
jgi:protein O-mannosyl-transferase